VGEARGDAPAVGQAGGVPPAVGERLDQRARVRAAVAREEACEVDQPVDGGDEARAAPPRELRRAGRIDHEARGTAGLLPARVERQPDSAPLGLYRQHAVERVTVEMPAVPRRREEEVVGERRGAPPPRRGGVKDLAMPLGVERLPDPEVLEQRAGERGQCLADAHGVVARGLDQDDAQRWRVGRAGRARWRTVQRKRPARAADRPAERVGGDLGDRQRAAPALQLVEVGVTSGSLSRLR
jgi:hypothetical protein